MLVNFMQYPSLDTIGNGISIDNSIQMGIRFYTMPHGAIFSSLVSCWDQGVDARRGILLFDQYQLLHSC